MLTVFNKKMKEDLKHYDHLIELVQVWFNSAETYSVSSHERLSNRQRELPWNKKWLHPQKPEATITHWEKQLKKHKVKEAQMSRNTQSLARKKHGKRYN